MAFLVTHDGHWSGGGEAMLRNFRFAAEMYPDVFTADPQLMSASIIPRNVPVDFPLTARPYVLAPQNAWPWHLGRASAGESWHVGRLRAASELAIRRSSALLRISSAIPSAGRRCSPVLHNVLDEGFDAALDEMASGDGPDLRDSIVSIGSLYSYRNLSRLLAAHRDYSMRGGALRLLIAGPAGSPSVVRRIAAETRKAPGVTLQVGSLSRARALLLMRDAAGVVLPSLVEASPVTALEAAALSGRVLLSDIVGHREILEGLGAVNPEAFCDPYDVGSIAAGLHRMDNGIELGVGADLGDSEARGKGRARWSEALVSWLADAHGFVAATGPSTK